MRLSPIKLESAGMRSQGDSSETCTRFESRFRIWREFRNLVRKPPPGCAEYVRRVEAGSNGLAIVFESGRVDSGRNVLDEVVHPREVLPFAVFGQALLFGFRDTFRPEVVSAFGVIIAEIL